MDQAGHPTGEAESGTVEEIREFVANGKPVLLYFSSVPVVPDSIDSDQYRRLKDFKESVRSQGLAFDFQSVLELRDLLYRHLNSTVNDLPRKTPGQSLPTSNSPAETLKQQIGRLAQGYDSFVRRLEVEWASERDSGTLSTDKGKYILDAAQSELMDFRAHPLVAENVQLSQQMDKTLRDISAIQHHQVYLDGGKSFREFWDAGNTTVDDISRARYLFDIDEERLDALRREANEQIHLALASNAENRTYVVVGPMIPRSKPADRWNTGEMRKFHQAIFASVSDRRVEVGSAAGFLLAQSPDAKGDVYIRISLSATGVAVIVFGWRGDPFPIPGAIAGLIVGVRMLLNKEFLEVYDPITPMEVTLGLVNWPDKGLSTENLWGPAKPHPIGWLKGHRVSHEFTLSRDDLPWVVVGPFLRYVLGDAGFLDYERHLDKPPPYVALVPYLENTGLFLT